jgi:A/G-specific adenine glycosylase
MMDLGAMICSPKSPACLTCPMAKHCHAYEQGIAQQLPKRAVRIKPTAITHHVLSILCDGKYLFTQRPELGLWSNMWQMPTYEQVDEKELVLQVQSQLGLKISGLEKLNSFKHQTTHRTITFTHWQAVANGGKLKAGAGIWRKLDDLADLPLAKPQTKVVAWLTSSNAKQMKD